MIGVITVRPLWGSVNRLEVDGRIVLVVSNTVNRCVTLVFLLAACHIGRPAVPTARFAVGQVVTPVAEAGLKEALATGLSSALSTRSMLGAEGATRVSIAVLSATTRQTGVGPNSQIYTATMTVCVRSENRSSQFSAERSYSVIDPVQGSAARAGAFTALAQGLMRDASLWLTHAPGSVTK